MATSGAPTVGGACVKLAIVRSFLHRNFLSLEYPIISILFLFLARFFRAVRVGRPGIASLWRYLDAKFLTCLFFHSHVLLDQMMDPRLFSNIIISSHANSPSLANSGSKIVT